MSILQRFFRGEPDGGREERFWRWFAANQARIHDFESNRERLFAELGRELHRVHKGLTFELGAQPEPDGRRRLVISADGIREVFPAVERLTAAAPQLPEWEVVAFRQPSSPDFRVEMGGRSVDADDIWFVAHPEDEQIGVTLYVRDLDPKEPGPQQGAVYILLDTLLGEYFVTMGIRWIDWQPLPLDPAALRLRPLRELAEIAAGMPVRQGNRR